jgi:hypothetical protein
MQALFMNQVPPSSRLFFNSGPKKALSLSLDENVISKPIKNNFSNYGINLKKIIQRSPIIFLPMLFAGGFPNKVEAVFFLFYFFWA